MSRPPRITPLDKWIKDKIGLGDEQRLTAEALGQYHTQRLRWVVDHAQRNSPFYREHLKELPDGFPLRLEDMANAPFTTEADVRQLHLDMLCVSQSEVSRVVTLHTSGSTGAPKRLYFTDQDLELTKDFFHHGMSTLLGPGSRVLILMPGATPASIGDLLKTALGRMNAEGLVHGPVSDPAQAIDEINRFQADCLVGLPVQVLGLARHPSSRAIPRGRIKNVLLSADYVPRVVAAELEKRWGASVFEHYGMTEMGLGGGVQCEARQGYHLREADLFFEVVDPITGLTAEAGQPGEVVFTTLTRQGMPLIRYRTNDWAQWLDGACPCGSSLPRLGKVVGRIAGDLPLGRGGTLSLTMMDEVLFNIPHLLNYQATLDEQDGRNQLSLRVYTAGQNQAQVLAEVQEGLMKIDVINQAVAQGRLSLGPVLDSPVDWPADGMLKRVLLDNRP